MVVLRRLFARRWVWLALPVLAVVCFGLWAGWRAHQVYGDLKAAEQAARTAMSAAEADDQVALEAAVLDLQEHAASAESRTGGPTWQVLTWVPLFGDDAEGVRALSSALDQIGRDGAEPLLRTFDTVRRLNQAGTINVSAVEEMQAPVAEGHAALSAASDTLHAVESDGFIGALKGRYEEFVDIVDGLDRGMAAAEDASRVLPSALGRDGTRTYLVVFLNNAEIRSSGGLPGAFAEVTATDGTISMGDQGGPTDMGSEPEQPVLPLTRAELEFFGPQLGTYFQDANFIQDMPRTAALMAARFHQYSGVRVDGVITLDTVGMSYLLDGAGVVTTPDGVPLTSANAVSELLNTTYLSIEDPQLQDARFRSVAQSTFGAITSGVRDQFALAKGLGRAAEEGRLLVHFFDPEEQKLLDGTRVAGELTTAPANAPEVDLGFDDVTASKMSYYLRYEPSLSATSCRGGVQQLTGEVVLTSDLTGQLAATLPDSISGGGQYGIEAGSQMPMLRIYGPAGGKVGAVRVDGTKVEVVRETIDGRPAVALPVLLGAGQRATVTWTMASGAGQDGPIDLSVTPSVVPGNGSTTVPSACS